MQSLSSVQECEGLLAPRGGARWRGTVCIGLAALEIIPAVDTALVDVEPGGLGRTGKAVVGASDALRRLGAVVRVAVAVVLAGESRVVSAHTHLRAQRAGLEARHVGWCRVVQEISSHVDDRRNRYGHVSTPILAVDRSTRSLGDHVSNTHAGGRRDGVRDRQERAEHAALHAAAVAKDTPAVLLDPAQTVAIASARGGADAGVAHLTLGAVQAWSVWTVVGADLCLPDGTQCQNAVAALGDLVNRHTHVGWDKRQRHAVETASCVESTAIDVEREALARELDALTSAVGVCAAGNRGVSGTHRRCDEARSKITLLGSRRASTCW